MSHVALISFLVNSINTRSLSSYLKSNGHDTTCYFCPVAFNERNMKELIASLREKKTSLAGISLVTDDYYSAVVVTKTIKKELGIPVIWGGAHVNIRPDECLRHADMICRGEGEDALLELVRNMESNDKIDITTKNIWFMTNDGIIRNELRNLEENLDKYPFPDFDLSSQYVIGDKACTTLNEQHLKGEYSIMTSRGCPYSCRYCYNNYRRQHYAGKGNYLRVRSIESVIDELARAKNIFKNLTRINFWDDSFVARTVQDFEIFKDLYQQRINLPFFALIEPMAFNEDKIKMLKDCGLSNLQVGIQTGSERVNREVYNRPVSNNKVLAVAESIHEMGIGVVYDLIFNNPYETKNDIHETIELLLQFPRPFLLQGYNLIFYPGTAITERALLDCHISLKPEVDDFSTIEGKGDSPIAMRGSGSVSSRFYEINYTSREKAYLNTVISLMAFTHVPLKIIRFFANSETPLKTIFIKTFVRLYTVAARIKYALTRHAHVS
jgi:anaerobic magnesium-protoporphyrin IX monomethyl ester cyclase